MEFLLELATINHSQTPSHESSLDLMDSLPTNDSNNNRAIIFSITGESVTFYQINLFKNEKLDFGNWDTVLYKFEKVVQK